MRKLFVAVFAFVGALTLMPTLFDWPHQVAFHISTHAITFNLLFAFFIVYLVFNIASNK